MQNSNNKKYKYIALSILLIVTLIIVITSTTYAFFQASKTNKNDIKGSTSSELTMDLKIKKLSTGSTGNLIPLNNDIDSLNKAIRGYGFTGNIYDSSKSCIDKNGYSICQIYEVALTNTNNVNLTLNGGITKLHGKETPNLMCAVMDNKLELTSNSTCVGNNTLANNLLIPSRETRKFYFIVYINNLHKPQTDTGIFKGTIKFSSVNGGNFTANFG